MKKSFFAIGLALMMSLGTISVVEAENTTGSNTSLTNIQNTVGDYGVVSKTTNIAADFESNLRTDLYSGGQTIGSSAKYAGQKGKENIINNITSDVTSFQSHGKTSIKFGEKVNINSLNYDAKKISVSQGEINPTVETILSNVSGYAKELQQIESQVTIDRTDQNNEKIDCASINSDVVSTTLVPYTNNYGYVQSATTSNGATGNLSQQIGQTNIIMNKNQLVIINVDTTNISKMNLTRFNIKVNGQTICASHQNDNVNKYSAQVVFNFGDYDGDINISEAMGIIIAPKANVTVSGTSSGQVICNSFTNPGGEWHYTGIGKTETPVTPEEPETPVTPEEPETPVTPEEPETPVTPEEPETPVTPEEPENPTTPEEPETPVTPEEPENPTTPEEPEVPTDPSETPEEPTSPETPSETPEEPETPVVVTPSTEVVTTTNSTSNKAATSVVETGDNTNLLPLMAMLCLSLITFITVTCFNKKRN